MNKLESEAKRFSKYGIIGLFSNASLYLLFLLLVSLGVTPVFVTGLCYVIGVAISYAMNRRWAFKSLNSHSHDLPRFIGAYLVGFLSTLVTISILLLGLPPVIAQALNIAITAVIIYGMLRILNFGKGRGEHAH